MSKKKYNNYYNYSKKEPDDNDILEELEPDEDLDEHPKITFLNVEENFDISNPENPPEEEIEKTDPENPPEEEIEKNPQYAELLANVYIREKPYGDKVLKEDLDLILASKVLKDKDGYSIVPFKSRTEICDIFVHEDGSVWYGTRFGYLMAKNKRGKEFIRQS